MSKPVFEVGFHKVHNRLPHLFWRYGLPKPLLTKSTVQEVGYQQYKWLWFYFVIPSKDGV